MPCLSCQAPAGALEGMSFELIMPGNGDLE